MSNQINQSQTMKTATAEASTQSLTTTSTSTSTSEGMELVFALQGEIVGLFQDAIENNSKNAEMTAKNGSEMVDSLNEQYEKIEEKEKEADKKKSSHSVWGFIKGLFDLTKEIDKLKSQIAEDVATFQFQKIGEDVSSGIDNIKNNAAIVDMADMGKLCFQVAKLAGNVGKDALSFQFKNVKTDAKSDFTKIEENPALSFAIQLLSYAAVGASLVGAAATGGALSFLVVAAVTLVAMASTLNEGSADILESLGVSKSLSEKIMSLPSFDDVSNGVTALLEPELKAMGLSSNAIKTIGDATTVLVVAGGAGLTGNLGIAAMAFGTTLSSLSEKIAKDSGATGLTQTILTVGLAVAGAIVASIGGCLAARGAGELSENSQKIMALANKVNYAVETASGVLDILSGGRNIDLAFMMKDIANIQSKIDIFTAQIKLNDTQLNQLSDQLGDIISQYSSMIDNFGSQVAAPAQAVARELMA